MQRKLIPWAMKGGLALLDQGVFGGTGYIARPVDISGKSEGVAFIRLKCPACAGSGRKNSSPSPTAG